MICFLYYVIVLFVLFTLRGFFSLILSVKFHLLQMGTGKRGNINRNKLIKKRHVRVLWELDFLWDKQVDAKVRFFGLREVMTLLCELRY